MPSPPRSSPPDRAEFRDGVVTVLPAVAAALPFGFLLGALAASKGCRRSKWG